MTASGSIVAATRAAMRLNPFMPDGTSTAARWSVVSRSFPRFSFQLLAFCLCWYIPAMPSRENLAECTAWCAKHLTGDEKGQAQIFLDRLFQAFGHAGGLDAIVPFD